MYVGTPRFAATSRRRFEFELFGTAHHDHRRRPAAPSPSPRPAGSASRSRYRPSSARRCREACLQRDRRPPPHRPPTAWSASRRRAAADRAPARRSTSATDLDEVDAAVAPGPSCPRPPDARAWPIITISRPCAAHLRHFDVDLGDQRTGRVEHVAVRARRLRSRTACDTPCAEKTTVAPTALSSSSSTNTAPFALAGRRRRTCCGRLRGARRSARRAVRARARRSRWRGRRRRRSRAGWRG